MAQAVTDRTLRSLMAATTHRHDVWDSSLAGFGVRLSPGGHCSFVVRYRVGGRLRSAPYPPPPGTPPRGSAGKREDHRDPGHRLPAPGAVLHLQPDRSGGAVEGCGAGCDQLRLEDEQGAFTLGK